MSDIFITTRQRAQPKHPHNAIALVAFGGILSILSASALRAQTLPPGVAQTKAADSTEKAAQTEARRVLISELRANGPDGASDGFVELANVSAQNLEIGGWSLRFQGADGAFVTQIPVGASIPAHGHFLLAGAQYSLAKISAADQKIERAFTGGVQLRDDQNRLVDAVGPRRAAAEFREGDGLDDVAFAKISAGAPVDTKAAKTAQFSCVRRFDAGTLRDSGDNALDFLIVSVSGKVGASAVRLGAPGPENLKSPPLNFANINPITLPEKANPTKTSAINNSKAAPLTPPVEVFHHPTLRDRDATGTGKSFGTLTLRCRLVNITDRPITRLNFRIDGITNLPTADLVDQDSALIADVRVLPRPKSDEKDADASLKSEPIQNEPKLWEAILDEPPAQPLGGGFNSSVTVQLPKAGLAPGAAGEVEFVLGVERRGRYRLVLDSEHFHLTFDGDTENSARSTLLNGQNVAATNLGGTSGGDFVNTTVPTVATFGGATTKPNSPTTNPNAAKPEVEKPNLATAIIVFEGNTEDEFEPTQAVASPLNISSFRVQGETIALRFGGALNGESATDITRYTALVNGETVEVERATYDAGSNTVSLVLSPGAVRRGDEVFIKWTALKDAQNRVLTGQVGPAKVP